MTNTNLSSNGNSTPLSADLRPAYTTSIPWVPAPHARETLVMFCSDKRGPRAVLQMVQEYLGIHAPYVISVPGPVLAYLDTGPNGTTGFMRLFSHVVKKSMDFLIQAAGITQLVVVHHHDCKAKAVHGPKDADEFHDLSRAHTTLTELTPLIEKRYFIMYPHEGYVAFHEVPNGVMSARAAVSMTDTPE